MIEVEGFLLAQAYGWKDGLVSVAYCFRIHDRGGTEETALIPYIDIYRVVSIGLFLFIFRIFWLQNYEIFGI